MRDHEAALRRRERVSGGRGGEGRGDPRTRRRSIQNIVWRGFIENLQHSTPLGMAFLMVYFLPETIIFNFWLKTWTIVTGFDQI